MLAIAIHGKCKFNLIGFTILKLTVSVDFGLLRTKSYLKSCSFLLHPMLMFDVLYEYVTVFYKMTENSKKRLQCK